MPSNNLIDEIKKEIYTEKYDQIIWENYKNACGKEDLYFPPSKFQLFVNKLLNFYEKNHIKSWRKKALAFCYDYILAEDEQTFSVNIGPVNQVLNAIAIWHTEGADSQNFEAHVDSWKNYCWLAEDGMKVQGYNGSFLWDTSFAYQAIAEAGLKAEFAPTLSRAFSFIKANRIAEDCDNSEKYFRHARKGAWAFSNLAQGWAVTDCTAEALRCALHYQKWHPNNPVTDCPTPLSEKEIFESIDLLLSFQNSNGGWASYELKRAPSWIEFLNPSEIFGDIMTEVTYVECSSATMQTLMQFQHIFPNYKTKQITTAIEKGMDFILKKQREDGSWYGSWAVCFTYGAWFALEAISHYLKNYAIATDKKKQLKAALEKGEAFLWSKQNEDGGWGENFESCVQKKWINAPSQIINTAWAVLGLLAMDSTNKTGLAKAIALIESRQMPNGDFPQEQISGVFNHNCMETYTAYRNVFPIWALARYRHKK